MGELLQIDVLRLDGGGEEERCGLREAVRIFCGQVVAGAALGELGLVLGMADQIISQTLCLQVPLRDYLNITGGKAFAVVPDPLGDFRKQQRIVRAAQNQCIYLRVFL